MQENPTHINIRTIISLPWGMSISKFTYGSNRHTQTHTPVQITQQWGLSVTTNSAELMMQYSWIQGHLLSLYRTGFYDEIRVAVPSKKHVCR